MSVSGDHSNKVIPCLYQGKQPSFHWHSVASRLRGNATQAKHGRTTSESTWSTCIIRVPPIQIKWFGIFEPHFTP